MFKKTKVWTEEEIAAIASKQAEKRKSWTEEEITELSSKLSKEIITAQAETMLERAKDFSDAEGKMDPVQRMAFTIKECNNFTAEYVTKMLTEVLK